MDQLGNDDQVSMTIENHEMLFSSDSEVESPSPRTNYHFRSEVNSEF